MIAWSEHRSYSPLHDAVMVRLSVAGERPGEYFMLLPEEDPRPWRERRRAALEMICEAIDQGCEPGEVRIMSKAA